MLDGISSLPMVRLFFGMALLCYFLFMIGCRTKTFHLLSFLFYGSILNRNFMTHESGDRLLLTMLFFSLFLPLGACFSMDGLGKARPDHGSAPSLAALAVLVQLASVYALTAFGKWGETWREGTAVYYALHLGYYTSPLGNWFVQHAPIWLLRGLSTGVLIFEYSMAPLILVPLGQPTLRRVAVAGGFFLHVGIWLCMDLFQFSFILISCLAFLVSPQDWRLWDRGRRISGVTIGPSGLARLKSAILRGAADLLVAFTLTALFLGNYNLVVHRELHKKGGLPNPPLFRGFVEFIGLGVGWSLFSPNPWDVNGWIVIQGVTESGQVVDPLTGEIPRWDKPPDLTRRYPVIWREYFIRIMLQPYEIYRPYFARYLAYRFYKSRGERLITLDLYVVREPIPEPGLPSRGAKRILLWHERFAPESP